MPSTSQLGANSRSMNGLNNISANTVFTDNLEVNNLTIDVVGTAPTRPPLDNSTKIATTSYVDTAVSAVGGVSLSGTNVFTGNNTYNVNLPTSTISATTANQLTNKTYVDGAITTASTSYAKLATANAFTSTNTFNSFLPTSTISATTANELVNKSTLDTAITTASGSYVTLAGTQTITGDKTYNGTNEFLSLGASYIYNTGSIDTPNIGSGLATDPISIVPSQSSGVCNIATFATRTGAINLGTGSSAKTLTIGGTGTTTNINSSKATISTSTLTGVGITHSSSATSGDNMRLTATGGYLARLGEGSSSAGLTLLGIDAGTSIIKATTSALEIRADAGLTFTGTIGSNNSYTGTNNFQNNVTVQAGNTVRYGSRSVSVPSGIDLGQTNTNEITLKLVTTADDFYFRTSANANAMLFDNAGITIYHPFAVSNNFLINQSTYPSTSSTQLGYTITKTFGPANISDTTGTFSNIGSQALGTDTGVYLITCGFTLTASANDTLNDKAMILSITSGTSSVPVNSFGAWEYFDEINDSMGGGGGKRYSGTLCGTYIKTTTSAVTLYLNGYGNTTGGATISCTGRCSITRIG
jgi:hypothetical protein